MSSAVCLYDCIQFFFRLAHFSLNDTLMVIQFYLATYQSDTGSADTSQSFAYYSYHLQEIVLQNTISST